MRLSASGLQKFHECPERWRLDHTAETKGLRVATSRMVYGTVVHSALHVYYRYGDMDRAIEHFDYFWNPAHTHELCEPIDEWVYGDDYSAMRRQAKHTFPLVAELDAKSPGETLALEYEFEVPVGTGGHTLYGFIDRLTLVQRTVKGKQLEILQVQDHKTGKRKPHPRHNIQGSVYAYALTQRSFWDGFGDDAQEWFERFKGAGRQFIWFDFPAVKLVDGGFRGQLDDLRVIRACTAMGDAVDAKIFGLNVDGSNCKYCPYAESICCGTGLPAEEHGLLELVEWSN